MQALKGERGPGDVIEVRLLATMKQSTAGSLRRATVLRDLPTLRRRA